MTGREQQHIISAFGKRLREIRERNGLSLRGLADLVDMDHSTIHRIEAGRNNPGLTTIIALARALDINIAELLHGIS